MIGVPEVMARSFWVAPICLRTDFTSSPICFGLYFMVLHDVTVREYNDAFCSKARLLFPCGNVKPDYAVNLTNIPAREDIKIAKRLEPHSERID